MKKWETLYAQYCDFNGELAGRMPIRLMAEFAPDVAQFTQEDLEWLIGALSDSRRKWFVAAVCRLTPAVPEALLQPLLQAAIDERDPSYNNAFIAPCIYTFGHRRVVTALLDRLEYGPDSEQEGAVQALYWTGVPLVYRMLDNGDFGDPTPESHEAYEALEDLWIRQRCLLLQAFISSSELYYSRTLISGLVLDHALFPEAYHSLVDEAIRIARAHPDEHIRNRAEVRSASNDSFIRTTIRFGR